MKLTLADLKLFFDEHIKNKNYTFLVLGNKDMVDHNALKELGNYEELDLDEIFGYSDSSPISSWKMFLEGFPISSESFCVNSSSRNRAVD